MVARLRKLYELTGHTGLVFPSPQGLKQPISEQTATAALHRLGYKGRQSMHGFRATASTMMHEAEWLHEAIETQLAHVGDATRHKNSSKAYNHAKYMDYRERMMRTWATFLEELTAWQSEAGPLPRLPKYPT